MRFSMLLALTVFMAVVCLVSVVSANEIIIFDDELQFGNLFDENRNGNMTSFEGPSARTRSRGGANRVGP